MPPKDSSPQESSDRELSDQKSTSQKSTSSSEFSRPTPVETLQKRYADQLSQDIEQLESRKSKLREDIQTLTRAYTRLQASVDSLRRTERSASAAAKAAQQKAAELRVAEIRAAEVKAAEVKAAGTDSEVVATGLTAGLTAQTGEISAQTLLAADATAGSERDETTVISSPRLPGELSTSSDGDISPALRGRVRRRPFKSRSDANRSVELPIPATSQQRRQLTIQSRRVDKTEHTAGEKKGLILSAIAALLMAWHFCVVAALGTGGLWLGVPIGTLGTGFMPAVALLWLRMLVIVPALVLLAPQLYEEVWDTLRDWIYSRDGLLLSLIGSGAALFISQALLYQCLGLLGSAVGSALLFLYPLSASPLMALSGWSGYRKVSALGGLALVAIAMGGVLTLKPLITNVPTALSAIWLGIIASAAFGLYVILTNLSYRQQKCHPIPASLVQFSVVAALSSVVLLAKPLEPVNIDWLSFALWGILLGVLMLLVYLFNYSSLRLIGPQARAIAAVSPLATLFIAQSFRPVAELAIIQWTGIILISLGGAALSKES